MLKGAKMQYYLVNDTKECGYIRDIGLGRETTMNIRRATIFKATDLCQFRNTDINNPRYEFERITGFTGFSASQLYGV